MRIAWALAAVLIAVLTAAAALSAAPATGTSSTPVIPAYIGQIDDAPGSYFPFSDRLRRPTKLDSYRSDYVVTRIRWRSWGGSFARGRGKFTLYLCDGPCARRIPVSRRARLTLSRPRAGTCRGVAVTFYTRLTVAYRLIDRTEPSGFRVRRDGERFKLDPACTVRTGRDLLP